MGLSFQTETYVILNLSDGFYRTLLYMAFMPEDLSIFRSLDGIPYDMSAQLKLMNVLACLLKSTSFNYGGFEYLLNIY